jgi:hypothetical protein
MTQQNPFQNRQQSPAPNQVDEFEIMRQRLKRRGATTGQERQRELSRQFAALGNLPSGAALKARQQTAQAQERATSEALQDVNVLQAQTQRQEREAEAGRQLQRDLTTQQIAGQRGLAELAASTDLEKARLAGANAIELQTLQNEASLRERQLVEGGMDRRLANQMANNRELFDLEMQFKREGRSVQEELARAGLDMQQQEFKLNQTVTALNSLDLLVQSGFRNDEIGAIIDNLNLPFKDDLNRFFQERSQRLEAPQDVQSQVEAELRRQRIERSQR